MKTRTKLKLYLGRCHYVTIYLDEVKNIEQNNDYWFIDMKDGDCWEDCNFFVITNDLDEKVGYFIERP